MCPKSLSKWRNVERRFSFDVPLLHSNVLQKVALNTWESSNDHLVVVIEIERWLIPRGENCKITAHRNMTAGINISCDLIGVLWYQRDRSLQ